MYTQIKKTLSEQIKSKNTSEKDRKNSFNFPYPYCYDRYGSQCIPEAGDLGGK